MNKILNRLILIKSLNVFMRISQLTLLTKIDYVSDPENVTQ